MSIVIDSFWANKTPKRWDRIINGQIKSIIARNIADYQVGDLIKFEGQLVEGRRNEKGQFLRPFRATATAKITHLARPHLTAGLETGYVLISFELIEVDA